MKKIDRRNISHQLFGYLAAALAGLLLGFPAAEQERQQKEAGPAQLIAVDAPAFGRRKREQAPALHRTLRGTNIFLLRR